MQNVLAVGFFCIMYRLAWLPQNFVTNKTNMIRKNQSVSTFHCKNDSEGHVNFVVKAPSYGQVAQILNTLNVIFKENAYHNYTYVTSTLIITAFTV